MSVAQSNLSNESLDQLPSDPGRQFARPFEPFELCEDVHEDANVAVADGMRCHVRCRIDHAATMPHQAIVGVPRGSGPALRGRLAPSYAHPADLERWRSSLRDFSVLAGHVQPVLRRWRRGSTAAGGSRKVGPGRLPALLPVVSPDRLPNPACPFLSTGLSTSSVSCRDRYRPVAGHGDGIFVPRWRYLVVLYFAGLNKVISSVVGHHLPAQKRRRSSFQLMPACLRRIQRITLRQV
jgi:hypothetical protein